ncbi:MAG: hypothetical protein J5824_05230 [Lachnospiraceae bacterium]|nr:hypothetical protein [Lachnospiraceae bacterium]
MRKGIISGGYAMSIVPMWKRCPKCHKKYSFNPDVGQLGCPNCGRIGLKDPDVLDDESGSIVSKILDGIKKKKEK